MTSFIPAGGKADDKTVPNDGFWPALSVAACRAETGLGSDWTPDRIAAEMLAVAINVNASLSDWRARQGVTNLADVPAPQHDGTSEKVILYRRAVYALVRAEQLDVTRDYDSTAKGHARADALAPTADSWRAKAQTALARLTGRPATVVELI